MWVLWLCIAGASGACGLAKEWAYPTEAACRAAIATARVETGVNFSSVRVTSVEVTVTPTSQVTMLCRPK